MNKNPLIQWLLEGDVSIQYQVWRDLLHIEKRDLQDRIAGEGWGKIILSKRHPDGHWGDRFYQPKWISTHYTLLDLRNLNFPPDHPAVQASIEKVLIHDKAADGGIRLGPSTAVNSDICVDAMVLNYGSYFQMPEKLLQSLVDCILNQIMPDGGFNCQTLATGAKHSSLHTTLSVLEGFTEFQKARHNYRKNDITRALQSAKTFILMHHLFLSDRTGRIINKNFLKLVYPCRWKYDILRAMDYFQYAKSNRDIRMEEALTFLIKKRNADGTWNVQAAHPGQVHLTMEQAGKPSRWNTLRMLRILQHFERIQYTK